jgi:hypothetical protein
MNKLITLILGISLIASTLLAVTGCSAGTVIPVPNETATNNNSAGMTIPEGQNNTPDNPAGMTMPAFDLNNLPAPENAAK